MAFTKAERSTATRRRLIATARALFAKRGFAAVGTEEIVKRARGHENRHAAGASFDLRTPDLLSLAEEGRRGRQALV
jgi:AcrR family transcriptional regulator